MNLSMVDSTWTAASDVESSAEIASSSRRICRFRSCENMLSAQPLNGKLKEILWIYYEWTLNKTIRMTHKWSKRDSNHWKIKNRYEWWRKRVEACWEKIAKWQIMKNCSKVFGRDCAKAAIHLVQWTQWSVFWVSLQRKTLVLYHCNNAGVFLAQSGANWKR